MDAKSEKKTESDKSIKKSPVHRSPNYPAFTLDEAIKKVRVLWEKDHRVGAHRDVVLQHLGYTTESGSALRTLATLKSFGLTTEKEGRIVASEKALDIVLYPQNDKRHVDALKDVALKPNIYNDLYGKYRGAFPSDESLKAELLRDYGFNPKQVDSFLTEFRETLKYAGLDRPPEFDDSTNEEMVEKETSLVGTASTRQGALLTNVRPAGKSYAIPLKNRNEAMLSFKSYPLEKADLKLIITWLELMEENLTEQLDKQVETTV